MKLQWKLRSVLVNLTVTYPCFRLDLYSLDFEAIEKADNNLQRKVTRRNFEHVSLSVTFHMTSVLGEPSFFESY